MIKNFIILGLVMTSLSLNAFGADTKTPPAAKTVSPTEKLTECEKNDPPCVILSKKQIEAIGPLLVQSQKAAADNYQGVSGVITDLQGQLTPTQVAPTK